MSEIPKIIHYCWFGGKQLYPTALKAVESWKRYAPGFEVRRCDEGCFDIDCCKWVRDAYDAGRFAFVSDYARLSLIYTYGGIYMDLGSELIRDITPLVKMAPLSAIEEFSKTATPGLIIMASPGDPFVKRLIDRYEKMTFVDTDDYLTRNTVNNIFTEELEKQGFVRQDRLQKVGNWTILPSESFNPVYGFGGFHITNETYSIHHYSGSWTDEKYQIKRCVFNRIAPFVGRRPAQIIGRCIGEIKTEGLIKGIRNIARIAREKNE